MRRRPQQQWNLGLLDTPGPLYGRKARTARRVRRSPAVVSSAASAKPGKAKDFKHLLTKAGRCWHSMLDSLVREKL